MKLKNHEVREIVINKAPVTLDRKSRLHLRGQYLGCVGSRLFPSTSASRIVSMWAVLGSSWWKGSSLVPDTRQSGLEASWGGLGTA